ncbi:WLM-domain-containing protein [Peniophora sp. CONT]|nr:WLM-domain-containing protein [Peniophora sp. CONT]
MVNLLITYRGTAHEILAADDGTLSDLRTQLENQFGVPSENQKLLYKGKKASHDGDVTLRDAGLVDGTKVTLLGPTKDELGGMQKAEDEQKRRERIMQKRAAQGTPKVRSSGPSASSNYVFHRLEPLKHLPEPDTALSLLRRLSTDPAIQHIMQTHKFAVGLLTELAPHEQPHLLGLNMNAGQAIKLRLRTDRYDGFRSYKEVRRVLCHELTHNVWGDHDDNFKELNSRLNREVAEYEQNTHILGDTGGYHGAQSELEAEARAYVLGGSGAAPSVNESVEERRRRVLDATMNRLRKEEEELEHSCGTAPSSHATTS